MATFPVVLDACVLYPMLTRDLLLRAAEAGLYRPHWSAQILEEATRNLVAKGKITAEGAAFLLSEMTRFFPEALVEIPQAQINAMLNDPADRHVAATAVVSQSSVIVTSNLKHFRAEHLVPWDIEAQSPDTFLTYLFDLYPDQMSQVVVRCAGDHAKPLPIPEIVMRIRRRLPAFATRLQPVFAESQAD
ncbi:PIN domain-containing protein [Gloeobacter morelensis]|uniref:PIN domain-containing protein n=1 Tax=Gloeobacter morelensis MG652769 TaxID=2781736 RepID=A0ABY3PS91_9CYAN|nr:PIN domain-containing protein [Gloeobacter morelensis]UFP96492.1 PIN domain-containing protein [Gloeobacter morelensis MG652769]